MSIKKKALAIFASLLALVAVVIGGVTLAFADPGQAPEHSKTAHDNGDGTYTLELSVTGDADDETQEAGKVNIVIVYDTSSSMTSTAQGSNYTRADQAEDVVHDFLMNLAGYQNDAKDNINVALVTFARATNNQGSDWTTNITGLANGFDDGGTDRQTSKNYSGTAANGTNWESALQSASTLLGRAPGGQAVPTFVLMMTDGACTASGNGNNAINPTGASIAQLRGFYVDATEEARSVAQACKATGGTFYGIYAYGTEADLLDDLMYFAENNEHRGGNINNVVAATQDAPNFFRAADTTALNTAITQIFNEVVNALGISSVSISDGTTNQVQTATGVSELLEVDESSYQYWLSIPVVNNQFTRKMNVIENGVSRIETVTYTVTDNNDGTCTVNWTEGGSAKSVTVDGSVSSGAFKYEWKASNDLYKYDPPAAHLNNGSVDWDLSPVGTLLDEVTYSVTFKVYPSQETLDDVADIKNDPGENGAWKDLDPAVQQYIDANGNLKTNTTATLTYSDTRLADPGPKTTTFTNPDPVENSAVEQLAVTKVWDNQLEDEWNKPKSIDLDVTRDGDPHYTVSLSDPSWTGSVYISIGIMGTDGKPLKGSEGHDFTFTEPQVAEGFKWEIDAPTVHPMLINNVVTMLVKVDADHPAPSGATTYEFNGATYYVDEAATALTATNERRSSLNIKKVVDGEDAPADAVFPFTLNVKNSLAPESEPTQDPGHDSDWWVWISVRDMSETDDPEQAPPVTDAVVSGATHAGGGWYYGVSGQNIVLNVKAGYSIRVNNLPTGTTYTITEGTLPNGFIFDSSEIAFTDGLEPDPAWAFNGNQTSTGSIDSTNALYTVTYTNKYELIDINVDKVWADGNDQDGFRPETLTLTLSGAPSGTTVPTPEITKSEDGNTWTYVWKGMPRYDAQGNELTYTVTEATVPENYTCETTTVNDGGTITNTHTPEVISIPVEKVWVGPKGDAVTVTLYADGAATQQTVTLNANNSWKGTFANLPKYADGEEIEYSVVEAGVSGVDTSKYSVAITGDAENGYTITNTNTETVDVAVTKVWDDGNNQDGIRPTSLTLTLNGAPSGTTVPDPTITKSSDGNSWTYTWAGLPKYAADGTEISYTVTEDEDNVPDDYEMTGSPASNGGTITNTHTPEETEATVKKVWDDADNQDGVRPTSLEVTLSDGQKVTLTASNQWTAKITGLPKYAAGEEITYTWTEGTMPEGYTLTDTTVEGTITTLTNSYTPEETGVSVVKVWDDAGNQDGYRPTSLTVNLLADGEDTGKSVTLSDSNNWTDSIVGLPKYDDGQAIAYTWDEGTIDEYTLSKQETDANGKTTLTNSHTPELVEVTVTKVWEDADNQDGYRPESITVKLLADGEDTGKTVVLSEDNDWTDTFTNLDKKKNGTDIVYTVAEVEVENYDSEISGDAAEGYIITNTHDIDTTEITVTKTWDDNDDQDGKRPTEITVKLLADGQETGKTAVLNEANEWTNKFENLPVNKEGAVGQAIVYTVSEDQVTDYEKPVITGDATQGFVVTNSHTPEKTTVTVTKTWNDADDQDGYRPESITVTLLANDEAAGTATLSEDNDWTYTWTDLDKYAGGEVIAYTVSEDQVAEYDEPEITGTAADGYTIKNTHTPKTTEITVTKVWEDKDDKDGIRPESVTIALLANGTDTGKTVVLSEDNEWTDTFTDLPVNEKGKAIEYTVKELEIEGYEATVEGDATEGFTVTNTHEVIPTPVISDPPVEKIVKGDKPEKDATFKFQMTAKTEGAPMPEGAADGVMTIEIVGSGSKEFGEMTFTEPGEYIYEITEIDTREDGYTYDKTAYTLTVTVEEDENGDLVKTEVITDGEGNEVEKVTFTNTYTAPKEEPKKPETPKTGDATPTAAIQLMVGFATATLVGASVLRTRTRED